MTSVPTISDNDLLWLRDRAVAATGLSVLIADARLPDTPVVDVNPAFETLTGYTADDALGRNCRFLQGLGTDPDTVARLRLAITDARHVSEVILNYRKDGTPFWNEVNLSPVSDRHGVLTHIVGLQQDVTARERGRRHLELLARLNELIGRGEYLERTLEDAARLLVPDLADYCTVHVCDEQGDISWSCTTGIDQTVAEAIGRHERTLPHVPNGDSGIAAVMRTGRPVLREAASERMLAETARSPEHRALLLHHGWRATMIVPIRALDQVIGTIHLSRTASGFAFTSEEFQLARDIGSRLGSHFENARLLHRAQSALITRERFLTRAAHELRTPVVSIKGYAQLLLKSLERGTLTRERLHQAIHTVEASAVQLSSLTDDLLEMSRHGTEATPLRHDRIETRSFLTTVMERSALRYDREFELDISAAPATFGADSARIEQVMSILLSNAVRHSGTDGTIRILAEAEDDGIRLSVQDRGRGLDRDELLSIFDSCERSNDEPDRRPGLGLGLFVSRKIIERHGGRLWAESAGRGHGARVSFWLPASSPTTSLDGVDPASGQDRDVRIA